MSYRLDAVETRLAIAIVTLIVLPASAAVSWQDLDTGIPDGTHLNGIWASAPDNVYIVGAGGGIWHYDGTGWSSQASHTSQDLYGIWGTSTSNVYAVGQAGTLLHSNGTSWSAMDSHTTSTLRRIWGSGPDDIWTVGDDSTFLHFDGSNWTNLGLSIASDLSGIWGTGPANVYAVDNAGRVLHYDGTNWSSAYTSPQASLWGIWGTAADNIFAVGSDNSSDLCRIVHYDGSNWSQVPTAVAGDLFDVWAAGPSGIYAVGTDAAATGTLILRYNGTTWSTTSDLDAGPLNAVSGSGANDVFAASHGGVTLYRGTQHPGGTVAFESATYSVDRFAGLVTLTVNRTGGEDIEAEIGYTTSNGTALADTDYTGTSGTLTFSPGQTSRTVDIAILDTATSGRTFSVLLDSPSAGVTVGNPSTAVVTIEESGPAPTLSIESQPCAVNVLPFLVTLSRAVEWPVLVDYTTQDGTAVADVNYTATSETLVLLPGETSARIDVELLGDVEAATGKTLSMVLSDPVGAVLDTAEATGEIRPFTYDRIGCGAGVGTGNLVVFGALCLLGLALARRIPRF